MSQSATAQQAPQQTPQELFDGALMQSLARQRDNYANAAAESNARLVVAQVEIKGLKDQLAAKDMEIADLKRAPCQDQATGD